MRVPLPPDPSPTLSAYAHPERLVTADWLSAHLGSPGLVIVESDEDVLLYDVGHIPGAVKIDWHTDLNDPVERDYVDGAGFAKLLGSKGITRDTTVVIYGDKNNWWALRAAGLCALRLHERQTAGWRPAEQGGGVRRAITVAVMAVAREYWVCGASSRYIAYDGSGPGDVSQSGVSTDPGISGESDCWHTVPRMSLVSIVFS